MAIGLTRNISHASSPAVSGTAGQLLRTASQDIATPSDLGSFSRRTPMARSQSHQIPASYRHQPAIPRTGKRRSFGTPRTPHRVENVRDYSPSEYTKCLDGFEGHNGPSALSNAISASLATGTVQTQLDTFGSDGNHSSSLHPDAAAMGAVGMSRSTTSESSICGGLNSISFDSTKSTLTPDLLNPYPSPDSVRTPSVNLPSSASFSPTQLGLDSFDFSCSDCDPYSVCTSIPSNFSFNPASSGVSSCGGVEMKPSLSGESDSSASSRQSRASRRTQEQIAQASRPIAPKPNSRDDSPATMDGQHKMIRISSSDGTHKQVAAIPKASVQRPPRQKTYCDLCNDQPEGFHGEHELRRHKERVHAEVRKVWVCQDISPDKKFLANCKACRNGKRYGANYNAAAHLRRTHFNPRQRGRGRESERRGGKGGGNNPPMDTLKHWMVQKEEVVMENTKTVVDPDALGDDLVTPVPTDDTFNRIAQGDELPELEMESFLMDGYDLPDITLDPAFEESFCFNSFEGASF